MPAIFRLFRPLALATALAAGSVSIVFADTAVSYPEGYRAWRHIKSMVILPGHPLADPFAGIHHV